MREEAKTGLIRNRTDALLAACVTGCLAVLEFRAVFSHPTYRPDWPVLLDPLRLPNWAVAAANLALCIYVLWVCIAFFGRAKHKERIMVAGFFATILTIPVRILVAPRAIFMIRSLQAFCIGTAFLAALSILIESPAFGRSDAATGMRLLLFLGIFLVVVLAIGALIYFRPW